jgi:transglutaminase-like putative cysteine protease
MRGEHRLDVRAFLHDELLQTLPADYDRDDLLAASSATYVIHQDIAYTYSKPIADLRQRLVVVPKQRHLDQRRIADSVRVELADVTDVRRRTDGFRNAVVQLRIPHVEERVEFRIRAVLQRSILQRSIDARRGHHAGGGWAVASSTLTNPDSAIAGAAAQVRRRDVATTVRAMSTFVRDAFEYCHDVTSVGTTAAAAWALRRGVCQDMAHVMLAMCACLDIPARYVSGHLVGDGASHAWVEAFDASRGEVISIDPTHDRLTDLRYITTATGRDYRDVAPTSGTYASTGARGTLQVRKTIRLAEVA